MKQTALAIVIISSLGLPFLSSLAVSHTAITETPDCLKDVKTFVEKCLVNFRNWVASAFVIISTIFFFYAAFLYLTAGDSEDKLRKANRMLLWALIGVVVALFAFGVITFVRNILSPGGGGGEFLIQCPAGQNYVCDLEGNCRCT